MKLDILALRTELLGRFYCDAIGYPYDGTLKIPSETEIREMFADYEDYEVYIDLIVDGKIDRLDFKLSGIDDIDEIEETVGDTDIMAVYITKNEEIVWSIEENELERLIKEHTMNNSNPSDNNGPGEMDEQVRERIRMDDELDR